MSLGYSHNLGQVFSGPQAGSGMAVVLSVLGIGFLCGLTLLVFMCLKGTAGPNRFGNAPDAPGAGPIPPAGRDDRPLPDAPRVQTNWQSSVPAASPAVRTFGKRR